MPDAPAAFRAVFDGVDVALLAGFVSQAPLASFDARGPLVHPGLKLVAVSNDEWEIGKNEPVAAGLLGDVKLNMAELLGALRATSQRRSEFAAATRRRSALEQRATERREAWRARVESDGTRLNAVAVASELAAMMPSEAVFADESVSNRQPFVNLLEFSTPRSYYSGKGGGLGFSTPGALGLRLGAPRQPVVNVIGDGAWMYYPQTLWSAANLDIGRLVVIVLNNASYRVLKLGTERMGGPWNARGSVPPGLDIDAPRADIAGTARTMGVTAERVESRADLRPALERAFGADRAYLVEVMLEQAGG
jgi:benzoylformate decarboxylase